MTKNPGLYAPDGSYYTTITDGSGTSKFNTTSPGVVQLQGGSAVLDEGWINGVATEKNLGSGVDPYDNSTAVTIPASARTAQVFVRGSRVYFGLTPGTINIARVGYADPGQLLTFDSTLSDIHFIGDASTVLVVYFYA